MKTFHFTICFFLLPLLILQCSASASDKIAQVIPVTESPESGFDSTRLTVELPRQIKQLKKFIQSQNGKYSAKVAVFIDMRIPSRHYRFFVVDLIKDSIMDRVLVAHGAGSETDTPDSLVFSNTPNSYMTSLGTYKIGASYIGNFGRSFRLNGLDPTNNKALARAVVLHRYSCIPEEEQDYPICTSLGCPMISEGFFPEMEKYIDASSKPILMEIYY